MIKDLINGDVGHRRKERSFKNRQTAVMRQITKQTQKLNKRKPLYMHAMPNTHLRTHKK